jgi:hypothetical protein
VKTPIKRLRELTKILKNNKSLIMYNKELGNGFIIESIYQPSDRKVLFLMNDYTTDKENKVIYLEDEEIGDDEILEIVYDLENMI